MRSPIRRAGRVLRALASSPQRRERLRREYVWRRTGKYFDVVQVQGRRGQPFLVSTQDKVIGRELFLSRDYDTEIIDDVIGELSRRGFVPTQLIDVGANIGTVIVDFLTRPGDSTAIAFEPDELNFALLQHNLSANGVAARATTHRAAISDVDGTVTLELSPENFGDHRVRVAERLTGEYGEERRKTQTVSCHRLDTLVDEGRIDLGRPTLVWADVQGHEAQMLAGAAHFRDTPIVLEIWPYGLRRAGGHELLQELMRSWAQALDARRGFTKLEPAQFASYFAEIERRPFADSTDVLLLPESLAGG
jgi:FkbM family methyltransferase